MIKKTFIIIIVSIIALVLFVWYEFVELDREKEEFRMCCVCPESNVRNIESAIAVFYAEPENMDRVPSLEYLIQKEGLALKCGSYQHTYTVSGNLDVIKITVTLDDDCECHRGKRFVKYMRLSNKDVSIDEDGWVAH